MSNKLTLTNMQIHDGISSEGIDQLVSFSRTDPDIHRFTLDTERFSSAQAFRTWVEQGRIIYSLSDEDNRLLGIIWFGRKTIPEYAKEFVEDHDYYCYTAAIRLYGEARGKHLSESFFSETFRRFMETPEFKNSKQQGFWIETSADNAPAIAVAEKMGFHPITAPNELGKIVLVRRVAHA